MTLYGAELARIQAEAFGHLAREASPALVALLEAAAISVRRVYDVGCGAGITTRALVEAGFETTAVEPSPHLLAIARDEAPAATFVNASAYAMTFETCGAVLAIGEVLTYHGEEDDAADRVQTFFAKAASALVPGGKLIFDLVDADGPTLDSRGFRTGEGWDILYETREDKDRARLVRHIVLYMREHDGRYRRSFEEHHVRLFREADVRAWLARAGFTVETSRTYGAAALLPRRIAYVATRR
jgi:SAM-dependent methyltransferase